MAVHGISSQLQAIHSTARHNMPQHDTDRVKSWWSTRSACCMHSTWCTASNRMDQCNMFQNSLCSKAFMDQHMGMISLLNMQTLGMLLMCSAVTSFDCMTSASNRWLVVECVECNLSLMDTSFPHGFSSVHNNNACVNKFR